ncbi:11728_t:CDS:2, partial [Funneliformis mosseae]
KSSSSGPSDKMANLMNKSNGFEVKDLVIPKIDHFDIDRHTHPCKIIEITNKPHIFKVLDQS